MDKWELMRARHSVRSYLDRPIEQDKREYQEYQERKKQRAAECKAKCDEISEHFKDVRRALWTEDVQLVEEWRAGLRQDEVEVTPPRREAIRQTLRQAA